MAYDLLTSTNRPTPFTQQDHFFAKTLFVLAPSESLHIPRIPMLGQMCHATHVTVSRPLIYIACQYINTTCFCLWQLKFVGLMAMSYPFPFVLPFPRQCQHSDKKLRSQSVRVLRRQLDVCERCQKRPQSRSLFTMRKEESGQTATAAAAHFQSSPDWQMHLFPPKRCVDGRICWAIWLLPRMATLVNEQRKGGAARQ